MASLSLPPLSLLSPPPAAAAPPLCFPRRPLRSRHVAVAAKKYKGTAMREEKLAEMIEKKVAEAMQACEGEHGGGDGCKVAWDEVEEVSQAKAHLRRRIVEGAADPLEPFCRENPEAEECAIADY